MFSEKTTIGKKRNRDRNNKDENEPPVKNRKLENCKKNSTGNPVAKDIANTEEQKVEEEHNKSPNRYVYQCKYCDNNKFYCESCDKRSYTQCDVCEVIVCEVCKYYCNGCDKFLCDNCIGESNSCDICDYNECEDCVDDNYTKLRNTSTDNSICELCLDRVIDEVVWLKNNKPPRYRYEFHSFMKFLESKSK